jgi:methylmalonyl-CoA mutase, N-terminal domain
MTLKDEQKRWEEQKFKSLIKQFPERKPEFNTPSGIPIPPIQTPTDPDPDYMEQLGFPGEYPYTRGVQPTMYRGRFWTMRQYAGYASS